MTTITDQVIAGRHKFILQPNIAHEYSNLTHVWYLWPYHCLLPQLKDRTHQ